MRSRSFLLAFAFAAQLAHTASANACGYCVEDKIASAYDHAVVTQALARHHHVVFFHIEGPLQQGAASKHWLEAALGSTPGVDKGSARIALDTLTISVAFDPQRMSLIALQNALDRKLAARNLSLFPLRVIEKPSELKAIAPH